MTSNYSTLILGSLPKTEVDKTFYLDLIKFLSPYSREIFSPLDTLKAPLEGRYDRAMKMVSLADLIVAEQSKPSTGSGMEIQEALRLGKKVIVIAREGSSISGLFESCNEISARLFYSNFEDLTLKLENHL